MAPALPAQGPEVGDQNPTRGDTWIELVHEAHILAQATPESTMKKLQNLGIWNQGK